jgi:hypothetical protein
MGRDEFLRRLVFNDHPVIDDHVEPLAGDVSAVIADVHDQLTYDDVPAVAKLVLESTRVNRFAQTKSEVVVDGEKPTHNRPDSFRLEKLALH